MKKGAAILALFYLISVVGYGMQFHYCLGQLSDVSIVWLDASCACDDVNIKTNCCEDKEFFIQVDEEHQSLAEKRVVSDVLTVVSLFSEYQIDALLEEQVSELPTANAPPLREGLYRWHSSFIFYG